MSIRKSFSDIRTVAGNLGSTPGSPLSGLDKQARRRVRLSAMVVGNLALLAIVAVFLSINRSTSQTVRNSLSSSAVATTNSTLTPLDQLSSAQIALQAAEQAHLPEVTPIRNTADSEALLLASVPNDSTILASPQIVTTSQKSRYQIIFYIVRKGDTISSIADKFHLTAGSVTGSNNLAGDFVSPGTTLAIPPAAGLVYKVKSGDTVGSIVNTYGADKSLFISVNDAENGVFAGERVWIPNAGVPTATFSAFSGFGSYSPNYGFNGYDYGFCTWYVASRISMPTNWGNANTWDDYARLTPGWIVSVTPRVGAIAQTDGMSYLGHVGIVEAVSADGSQIKYSDMNGLAGFGVVGYSGWVSVSSFEHYIHR